MEQKTQVQKKYIFQLVDIYTKKVLFQSQHYHTKLADAEQSGESAAKEWPESVVVVKAVKLS